MNFPSYLAFVIPYLALAEGMFYLRRHRRIEDPFAELAAFPLKLVCAAGLAGVGAFLTGVPSASCALAYVCGRIILRAYLRREAPLTRREAVLPARAA